MPGTFVFRPIKANLSHDTDLVGKMNPYCAFSLGHNSNRTKISKEGGKTPQWNDTITLHSFSDNSTANLEILDKEDDILMMKDALIGSCSINLKEIESKGQIKQWYPLNFKNRPAGEVFMEASFEPEGSEGLRSSKMSQNISTDESETINVSADKSRRKTSTTKQSITKDTTAVNAMLANDKLAEKTLEKTVIIEADPLLTQQAIVPEVHRKVFTEQNQIIEPHTFQKEVEVVETVAINKTIEVMEPRKVIKDVAYTELVPVTKTYEVTEPVVVVKEVDAIEPQVITRFIKVVENVPVKKMIEVIEMHKETKEIEVLEPQTFKKMVEVIEYVPVKRLVEVTNPVHVTKAVEFIEPVITTQTITKEILEPVVVKESITQEVGPATLLGNEVNIGLVKEEIIVSEKDHTATIKETVITPEI